MRKGEGTIPMHCCTISFQDYPRRWRVTFPYYLSINLIVVTVGFEPTCNQLRFQLLIRERRYTPITHYLLKYQSQIHTIVPQDSFNNILLKEEDLHFRSHLCDTQFTTEPICLHQSISTSFSSGILQRFSCGRDWSRTNSFGVSVQRFYRVSFSSFICFNSAKI